MSRFKLRRVPLRLTTGAFILSAGALGRIGAMQGVSEVATNTADAELYKSAVPLLFRGDIASVDGLRGYAAGLALQLLAQLDQQGLRGAPQRRGLRQAGER